MNKEPVLRQSKELRLVQTIESTDLAEHQQASAVHAWHHRETAAAELLDVRAGR